MKRTALNIHLFREDITKLNAVRPKYLNERLKELQPTDDLPFPATFYVQTPRPKLPRWFEFVETTFQVRPEDLQNQYAGALLLLEAEGRLFAVSFGHGANAVERELLEPDFGLRVVLNLIPGDKVRKIDARTMEQNVLQRSARASEDGPLHQLRMDLSQDWVRSVRGQALEDPVAGVGVSGPVEGADTVKLSWAGRVDQLGQLCASLLDVFKRDKYKDVFPFLDTMRPVKIRSPLWMTLETRLLECLSPRVDGTRIGLAYPSPPHSEQVRVRFSVRNRPYEVDELCVAALENVMSSAGERDPDAIRVTQVDDHGQPLSTAEKLRDFLTAEVKYDDETYLLNQGQWFRIERDFVRDVEQRVKELPDFTDVLKLPRWLVNEQEGAYNARVSAEKKWVNLDLASKRFHRSKQQIEYCDLLARLDHTFAGITPGPMLICVKMMRSSASLSHLYAQGLVSARMMHSEKEFRAHLDRFYRPFGEFSPKDAVVVYVVGTEGSGSLSDHLFLFSKVNLLHFVQELQERGVKVAIAKAQKEVAPTIRPPMKKR